MKPFKITVQNDVDHAQAWGCWLYAQFGRFAIKAGRHMRSGLRITWINGKLRVSTHRFL